MTPASIPKHVSLPTAVLLLLLAAPVAHAKTTARYEAVFSDGARVDGDKVSGWHEHPGSPRLDNTVLFDAKRPLRWLRDNSLKPWRPGERCPGYIEFIGGDRLVGRIVSVGAGDDPYVPAHLLVSSSTVLYEPAHVRILPERIERVVFGPPSRRRLQPGALYYLDGRRVDFVHLRWRKESVVLLLKDGTREVKISEIAEVHLPPIDPWRAYYQELAVLNPACRSRMVRLETTGGLIATSSSLRFGASPYGTFVQQQEAVAHLQRLDKQIAGIESTRKANQLKLDQARTKYHQKLAESEKQQKAARQAHQKAVTEMRRRIDGLRRTDAAEWTKRREKLDQELRAAEQATQQRLAKEPAEKRDKMLRTFRAQQAQLRKSRKKVLEAERLKSERQRKKELDGFISGRTQKLKHLTKELQKQAADPKRRFEEETRRWEGFLRNLGSIKSQRASACGARGGAETWRHIIQPVWSLDLLSVPFRSIHMRWSFAPEQVPLCRVPPAATVGPPFLPMYTNRNSAGRPLHSGGRQYAWGFAVHAYSELRFPLPKCANAFRSRIGLDRLVGPGGCVRARVYVGSTAGNPLYEGPLLVGSKKTADTGRIRLHLPSEGPRHLILQADPAHDNRPRGADSLNIRDKLDWLDPRIELDTAKLQGQVRLQAGSVIAASPGWKLELDKRGVYTRTSYLYKPEGSGVGRFWTMIRAQGQPLRFSRGMTIGPADKWLAVHVSLSTGESPRPDAVALRVGERQIQARKIPIRQRWQDWPAPLLFGLDEYQGKKVTLELTQGAGGKPLHWQAVKTSKKLPQAYHLARILELAGQSNLQIPRVLGLALHSRRMNDRERIALIEIHRHGGIMNFSSSTLGKSQPNDINNVLVGEDWRGGDKTFRAFQKVPSLKSLILVKDSGVSSAAVEKLLTVMPDLKVEHFERLPSFEGKRCTFWMQNHTGKEVEIYWISQGGNLSLRDTLDNTGHRKRHYSNVGCRFEAHVDGKRISKFTVMLGRIWEITPPGK